MSDNRLTPVARRLRRTMTDAEAALWSRLRGRHIGGTKFRRQAPVDRYVVDFLCSSARLVVELDGGQHAQNIADEARTRAIEACGYRVIRFWNHDVLGNIDGVLETIERELAIARNLL